MCFFRKKNNEVSLQILLSVPDDKIDQSFLVDNFSYNGGIADRWIGYLA